MRIVLAACLCLCGLGFAAERRPNVVLLVLDDLGYAEPGCYGGKDVPTPHIDALARSGTRFLQGYVTASLCAPSRAALLTGRYQTRFGYELNPTGAQNAHPAIGIPAGEQLLPEILCNAGYATGLIGKWHLGGTAAFHPQRRGFDTFFGFLHEGHYYVPHPWDGVTTWLRRTALPDGTKGRWTSPSGREIWSTHMDRREPDYDADNPLLRGSQPAQETEYLTDAFARESERFIDRHAAQPFFLYVAFNAVHSPMQGKDAMMERFKHIADPHRRVFAAMLASADDAVGRILAKLDALNLRRDTLVVLLSDNGGATRELTSSNAPLRGEKGSLYEGGVRVPFLLSWPGTLPENHTESRVVASTDIVPTVLAAAAARAPENALDGTDLRTLLESPVPVDGAPPRPLYWRMGSRAAMRRGEWKIVGLFKDNAWNWELFNLSRDPGETTNLAAAHPAELNRLAALWQDFNAQMKPASNTVPVPKP